MKGTPSVVTMTKKSADPCPKGRYLAICGQVTIQEPQQGGKYESKYPQLCYPFTVKKVLAAKAVPANQDNPDPKQPEDWIGETIRGYTGTFLKEGSKGSIWAAALLVCEEDDLPEELDTDDFEGRLVEITVGRSETGNHKITLVAPYIKPVVAKNGKGQAAPALVEDTDEAEGEELNF
jgi:hypothetical protein